MDVFRDKKEAQKQRQQNQQQNQQQQQSQNAKPAIESSSFGRIWSTNASQLDKIDAIPTRQWSENPRDNVLIDGLCLEDQIYLRSLIEVTDSSEGEEPDNCDPGASQQATCNSRDAWKGPMVQKPVVVNKRIKMRKTHYAVTLSLEDISYIRPSWGLSKGMKGNIQINKKHKSSASRARRRSSVTSLHEADLRAAGPGKLAAEQRRFTEGQKLGFYLILLTMVVVVLMCPSVFIERNRQLARMQTNRIRILEDERILEFYRPSTKFIIEGQQSIFKLRFGQNIPLDLRAEKCNCKLFNHQYKKQSKSLGSANKVANGAASSQGELQDENVECLACLDWAYRANLRIFIERFPSTKQPKKSQATQSSYLLPEFEDDERDFCYHIKWQNYNTLMAPLVDCFNFEDEHWFGFGDILDPSWPVTRLDFNWKPLKSNLTSDLLQWTTNNDINYINNLNTAATASSSSSEDHLEFGSYVNFTLLSSSRILLGNLRTDFEILARLNRDPLISGKKLMCLSATCTDRCTETWQRDDNLEKFRYVNNIFEYSICTMSSFKKLISRQISQKSRELRREPSDWREQKRTKNNHRTSTINQSQQARNSSNELHQLSTRQSDQLKQQEQPINNITTSVATKQSSLPDGIGLIERIVFATSIEFMPTLDGSTIREHVDSIVNLDLKSSLILSLDTRWQTYEGSFRLNSALFPKAKLLLEILHNKGFKIIFSIKPYIDGMIGLRAINELFAAERLYPTNFVDHKLLRKSDPRRSEELSSSLSNDYEFILRRDSFFKFRNQSVRIRSKHSEKFPHLFNCKESLINSCALFDLTKGHNREAIISSIKKTDLLAFGADGIRIGGVHSNFFAWQGHFRDSLSELVKDLFYREKLFTLSRYTGDFGYIELAPRPFTWVGLKSSFNSVLNLGMMGFSLIHPASVWGDLKSGGSITTTTTLTNIDLARGTGKRVVPKLSPAELLDLDQNSDEELAIRWLQLYTFMPILQFNNLVPIERFQLHDQMRALIRMRKTHLVPELKRHLPYTPLVTSSKQLNNANGSNNNNNNQFDDQMPLIRPVWITNTEGMKDTVVSEQFMVGPDIIVAPILTEGQRQRDIYLPFGLWRDELRHVSLRGGKWLRNYPVELNEIAWFSLDKR